MSLNIEQIGAIIELGLLPVFGFCVRVAWCAIKALNRIESRIYRVELHLGIERDIK